MSTGIITHRELDALLGRRRRQRWQQKGRLPAGEVLTGHRERVTIFPELVLALLVDERPRIEPAIQEAVMRSCRDLLSELSAGVFATPGTAALRENGSGWDYRRFARRLIQSCDGSLDGWRARVAATWVELQDRGVASDRVPGRIVRVFTGGCVWEAFDGALREEHRADSLLTPLAVHDEVIRLRVSVGSLTRVYLLPSGHAHPTRVGSSMPGPDTDPLGSFVRVATAVQKFIEGRLDPPSDEAHAHLKRAYEYSDAAPTVDYDVHAGAFARSFFAANYWKTAHALVATRPTVADIVDVGSGSAAAAVAALAWLDHTAAVPITVPVQLIDRSRAQLQLGSDVVRAIAGELEHVKPDVTTVRSDVRTASLVTGRSTSPRLVLLSHVLTENRSDVPRVLRGIVDRSTENSRVLVLERDDDPAWEDIDLCLRKLAVPREKDALTFLWDGLAARGAPPISDEDARPRVRYLHLQVPPQSARAVTERYFEAWSTGSVDLLDEVFTEGATYSTGPFAEPLTGLDAIRRYWHEKVVPQQDVRTAIGAIEYADRSTTLEWETAFNRGVEAVRVRGVMRLGIARGQDRIDWLREYYTKQVLSLAD